MPCAPAARGALESDVQILLDVEEGDDVKKFTKFKPHVFANEGTAPRPEKDSKRASVKPAVDTGLPPRTRDQPGMCGSWIPLDVKVGKHARGK